MKIAVIFLVLYVKWLGGGQAVSTTSGQLYSAVAGRDLADDVTCYRFDVRSRLDCASACAESDYCGMFVVCRHGPGTSCIFFLATIIAQRDNAQKDVEDEPKTESRHECQQKPN